MRRAENSTRCYIRICQLVLARMMQGRLCTAWPGRRTCQLTLATLARMMQGRIVQTFKFMAACQLTLARMMQGHPARSGIWDVLCQLTLARMMQGQIMGLSPTSCTFYHM